MVKNLIIGMDSFLDGLEECEREKMLDVLSRQNSRIMILYLNMGVISLKDIAEYLGSCSTKVRENLMSYSLYWMELEIEFLRENIEEMKKTANIND